MDEPLLKLFIAVTAIAVVVQAGILLGLYLSVRKSSAKIEALASEVLNSALPAVETALGMLGELRPKIEALTDNVSVSGTLGRKHFGHLDRVLSAALDSTRVLVMRPSCRVTGTL